MSAVVTEETDSCSAGVELVGSEEANKPDVKTDVQEKKLEPVDEEDCVEDEREREIERVGVSGWYDGGGGEGSVVISRIRELLAVDNRKL